MINILLMYAINMATAVTVEAEPILSTGDLITIGVVIASVTSMVVSNKNATDAVKKDITRLEAEQKKYNNLQERTWKGEESLKVAHNRIKDCQNDIRDLRQEIGQKLDVILQTVSEHVEKFHTNHKEE